MKLPDVLNNEGKLWATWFLIVFFGLLVLMYVLDEYSAKYPIVELVEGTKLERLWVLLGVLLMFIFVLPGIIFFLDKKLQAKVLAVIFLFIPLLVCLNSSAVLLNALLDSSNPVTVNAKVLEKRYPSARGTRYAIRATSELYNGASIEFRVEPSYFFILKIGDKVKLNVRGGWLGMEWMQSIEVFH